MNLVTKNDSPLLLFIVGPMAVGKMTVGRAIAERTGLKLFHNHMSIEIAAALSEYDDPAFQRINMGIRRLILEEMAASDMPGLIFTRVHLFDDPEEQLLSEEYERPFREHGGRVLYAELEATTETRLQRTEGETRLAAKPTQRDLPATRARLLRMDARHQLNSNGELDYRPDYLRINNTTLSAAQVAEHIISHFSLPARDGATGSGARRAARGFQSVSGGVGEPDGGEGGMTEIEIELDEALEARLREMAREQGVEMEELVREALIRGTTAEEATRGARRTVTVSFQVDVPPGVTDEYVEGVCTAMMMNRPELTGWWFELPEVGAVYAPGSQSDASLGKSGPEEGESSAE